MEFERVLVVERNRNPYKEFLFLENAVSRIDSSNNHRSLASIDIKPGRKSTRKAYRWLAAVVVAGALVVPHAANATIVSGWNVFHSSWYYLGKTPAGVPFIWVNSTEGDRPLSLDPTGVGTDFAAKACADGNGFYVHVTMPSGVVNAFEFVPGSK
jgi:hypothetical protein